MNQNPYINIKRIEFAVTFRCSGACRHCSVGDRINRPGAAFLDPARAAEVVERLAECFRLESVLAFGGEPLLYPDSVEAICSAATRCGVPTRQLITNGCFSKDEQKVQAMAERITAAGVNDILLSVDAFHQERLPLAMVRRFAEALLPVYRGALSLHPAWVAGPDGENEYDRRTRDLLAELADLGLPVSEGNIIFLEGNAAEFLGAFYPPPGQLDLSMSCGSAPYTDRLDALRSLSVEPNGDVTVCDFVIGNVHQSDIGEIVGGYDPRRDPLMRTVLEGGVPALLERAKRGGVPVDLGGARTACAACKRARAALRGV